VPAENLHRCQDGCSGPSSAWREAVGFFLKVRRERPKEEGADAKDGVDAQGWALQLKEEEITMALSILTNTASLNAQRNLSQTGKALSANFSRLSSGMRINTAGDDAAGLAISERMKSQIRSMSQAERNSNDGISLLQTAEGAMNENSGILVRMRELSMQSANGTLGQGERDALQTEFGQLTSEIDRIANVTQFNGRNLLDGSNATFTFQVGINTTAGQDTIDATMSNMKAATYGTNATDLTGLDISSSAGATAALTALDTAIDDTSTARAGLGATQNRLQVTVTNLQSARENLSAANSRIRDVDVAEESAAMTRNNILSQAGMAVLSQANQLPSLAPPLLRGFFTCTTLAGRGAARPPRFSASSSALIQLGLDCRT
jgi:flagellin